MHYKLLFTEQWAALPVLHQVPTSCLFHTWKYIYVNSSLPVCPNLPSSPCARPCPHAPSLQLHVYSCPGNRFTCIIFLNSTYVLMTVFWKKMMKVMGMMVMIVIGGDEGDDGGGGYDVSGVIIPLLMTLEKIKFPELCPASVIVCTFPPFPGFPLLIPAFLYVWTMSSHSFSSLHLHCHCQV